MLDEQDLLLGGGNKVAVFTGAGLSQESGIPTFREAGGLWEQYDTDVVCNIATIHTYRKEVFEFYNKLKSQYSSVEPNAAHYELAELQRYYGQDKFTIYTANVDMLLEEAGCSKVVHVHGDNEHSHCMNCGKIFYIGDAEFDSKPCPNCSGGFDYLKPGVVFFGEHVPLYSVLHDDFARPFYIDPKTELMEDKLKLFIGTSFSVIGEGMFSLNGNNAVLVDANPKPNATIYFSKIIKGNAAQNAKVFSDYIKNVVKR